MSAARLFAVRRDYQIRTDQELFAAGTSNVAALMGGLSVAGSLSKTAAVDQGRGPQPDRWARCSSTVGAGHRPPCADLLSLLPKALLSAIVVHAVWGLIDLPAMRRYRRSRRIDFLSALVAVVGVLAAGTFNRCWSRSAGPSSGWSIGRAESPST